jgi:hypothetical protein
MQSWAGIWPKFKIAKRTDTIWKQRWEAFILVLVTHQTTVGTHEEPVLLAKVTFKSVTILVGTWLTCPKNSKKTTGAQAEWTRETIGDGFFGSRRQRCGVISRDIWHYKDSGLYTEMGSHCKTKQWLRGVIVNNNLVLTVCQVLL